VLLLDVVCEELFGRLLLGNLSSLISSCTELWIVLGMIS